jgi:hypothetical protein
MSESSIEKDVGVLEGKMELFFMSTTDNLKKLIDTVDNNHKTVTSQIQSIEERISVYSTVIKTLKFIGLALGALITFKAGDIFDLWGKIH